MESVGRSEHDRRMETLAHVDLATLQDMAWIMSVDRHVPELWVRRCIEQREYLIARSNERAVGVLRHSKFWGVIPFMDFIHVEPPLRRRGIGVMLLREWEAAMRRERASMLMTSSMADEAEPQAWHQSNGFRLVGTLNLQPHQSTPEVFFSKQL